MIKVGITGGIGSGKSIICEVFKLLGVPVYHADIAAKILSDTDDDIRNELIRLFGEKIYDGKILNRKLFSEIIFNDQTALNNTNRIFHYRVVDHFQKWAELYQDSQYILMEAAILLESGTYKILDRIITVSAPEQIRISRTLSKGSFNRQIIKNIIKSQHPEEEKIKQSDYVIYNDNKTLILPQILEIHEQLNKLK
jgi:dephospho-CoA kinase